MHNKAWIADGRLAIVGGRNVGDAYFSAARHSNFQDLDLLVIGPAAGDAQAIFDEYWQCAAALPARAVTRWAVDPERFRKRLESFVARGESSVFLRQIVEEHDAATMLARDCMPDWSDKVRILADPPRKVAGDGSTQWLSRSILPVITEAARKVEIVSPYFIPGAAGVAQLAAMTGRGVEVTVATNSLAATDSVLAHGAYAGYRAALLSAGVKLYELRPEIDARRKRSVFGSAGSSLHMKAFTVDDRWGFVGSFNFDPRSVSLNTEMGALFDDPVLAGRISAVFSRQISCNESFRLGLEDGQLVWEEDENGKPRIWRTEPRASRLRLFATSVFAGLPIESQL